MRTNLILLLALLVFLVGFFSSEISLTGYYSRSSAYTSLTEEELATLGSLTLDDCRNIARFAAYEDQSNRFVKMDDPSANPKILNTNQYQRNYYSAFDITHDGDIDNEDVRLCYNSVREVGDFNRRPDAQQRASVSAYQCSPEGRETCRYNILMRCTPDSYGILSWAEVAKPNAGQKCRGERIVERIVGKQPLGISFLFTAPSP